MIKCSQAETSEDFEKNKTDLFEFQFIYGSWQEWKPLKRVQTLKIKKFQRTFYCLCLKTFAGQLSFVVQFCYFMFSFLLKLNSFFSFRPYNLKLKMIKCSQAETSEDFEKNKTDLFEFQFIYGSWQEWKPLKRVQTLKIKKFQRTFYCLCLKTFAWQLSFVVQFYFMLSFLLKFNSFFRSYNLELEMIRCSQEETPEDFEKNKTAIWFTICLWILRKVKAALESSNFENKKYFILLIAFIWKLLHDNYHLLYSFISC